MKDGVVLDLETLGSVNNSVILSVGMVAVDSTKDYTFDELIKDGYYANWMSRVKLMLEEKFIKILSSGGANKEKPLNIY